MSFMYDIRIRMFKNMSWILLFVEEVACKCRNGVHKYGVTLRTLVCEWSLTEAFAFRTTNERVMIFHSALASSALRLREVAARAEAAMAEARTAVTLLWPLRRRRWAHNTRVSGREDSDRRNDAAQKTGETEMLTTKGSQVKPSFISAIE